MDERVGDAIADGMDLASRKLRDAPRRLFGNWVQQLPLDFRVLYKQFLLRVIDLESLSIEADIPRFLGQFAGILIMFSLLRAVGMLFFPPPPAAALSIQQSQFSLMMLIAGLITVISWDSIFPDRRDVMILAPLPVRPHIILLAKLAASAGLIGLAIVCVNCASSLASRGASSPDLLVFPAISWPGGSPWPRAAHFSSAPCSPFKGSPRSCCRAGPSCACPQSCSSSRLLSSSALTSSPPPSSRSLTLLPPPTTRSSQECRLSGSSRSSTS